MENLQPKVLRPKQACQYLGIGLSTFWRWVQDGKLPQGTRLSARCTVWKVADLDKYLAQAMGENAEGV